MPSTALFATTLSVTAIEIVPVARAPLAKMPYVLPSTCACSTVIRAEPLPEGCTIITPPLFASPLSLITVVGHHVREIGEGERILAGAIVERASRAVPTASWSR